MIARLLAAWRARNASPSGRLAITDALALDPRRRLLLVRADDRQVLILLGGPQDVVIGWLP